MTQSGHGRVRIAALSHCAKNTHLRTAHKGLTERFTELQYRWHSRASSSQGSPTLPRAVSQPAFISCVREGADKLVAFQSDFQGFLLNPGISSRRVGIHSGVS